METRAKNDNSQGDEWGLLVPKTPDLSLRRLDRVVSFKLPKFHHKDEEADDLPDITPELKADLQAKWNLEEVVDERPVRMLIAAVRSHLDAINPYFEAMKDYQRSWFECWRFLYTIAQNLDMAAEAPENQKYYSVPDDLKLLELRTRANLGKADTDFQAATEAFTTELDRRMAEINELKKKVEAISKADSLAELMKYDNLKVARNGVTVKTATSLKPGCCAWFMRLFHQTNSPAQPAMTVAPDAQKIEEIRARLLSEYDSEIKFRVGLYNDYGDNGPRKTDQYRSEWNAVKAKIIHDQIDFYRGQSKDVMLHCLRLYVLTIRTYFLVYGENPLAEEKTSGLAETGGVKKDFGDHEKPVLKAKELFRQMAKGMKSQLSLFYCLQPDRYGFMNYLENYNSIQSQQDRDAVLAGKATEEMLEKIFPQFEAPEEAFQLRSSH